MYYFNTGREKIYIFTTSIIFSAFKTCGWVQKELEKKQKHCEYEKGNLERMPGATNSEARNEAKPKAVAPKPELLYSRRDALVPEEHRIFDDAASGSTIDASLQQQSLENFIIIPQMQIYAHDLHIYKRAIADNEGLLTADIKTPKEPWIFKRLYDWSQRAKAREVLKHLHKALGKTDKEYVDESLIELMPKSYHFLFEPENADNLEKKRLQAVWELFHSEVVFLYQHLLALRNVYQEPLKECQVEGYLLSIEPELIFGNLEELCQVSFAFCREFHKLLLESRENGPFAGTHVVQAIFDKFAKNLSPIAAYQAYCMNYKAALLCAQDPRCNRLLLDDLLITPLHRITRIPLLLKEISKYTQDTQEKGSLENVIGTMHESLLSIDESLRWLQNFERLQALQKQLVWPSVQELDPKTCIPEFLKLAVSRQYCENLLAHPHRTLVHQGVLQQIAESPKHTEIYAFLFNDMFLRTKCKKSSTRLKTVSPLRPAGTFLNEGAEACDTWSSYHNYKFTVLKQAVPLDSCVLCDVGPQDSSCIKEIWIRKFQECIENHESIHVTDALHGPTAKNSKNAVKTT